MGLGCGYVGVIHSDFFYPFQYYPNKMLPRNDLIGKIFFGGPSRPLNKWSFAKDHYLSRDLFHQQFQGTISLMVGLLDFQADALNTTRMFFM